MEIKVKTTAKDQEPQEVRKRRVMEKMFRQMCIRDKMCIRDRDSARQFFFYRGILFYKIRENRIGIIYVSQLYRKKIDDHQVSRSNFLKQDKICPHSDKKTVAVFDDAGTDQLLDSHIAAHLSPETVSYTHLPQSFLFC